MKTTINTNDILTVTFITDSQLKPQIKVLERKGSFATLLLSANEKVKRKVYSHNGEEYVFPYGKYSMAPIANK